MRTPRIFLSYLQRDSRLAGELTIALRKMGVDSFQTGLTISAGNMWSTAIDEGIRRADAVVVLLSSPEAARSSWIGYEVGFAQGLGKTVVLLRSIDWSVADYPTDLQHLRMIDLDPKSPEKTARALMANLPIAA